MRESRASALSSGTHGPVEVGGNMWVNSGASAGGGPGLARRPREILYALELEASLGHESLFLLSLVRVCFHSTGLERYAWCA